MRSTEPLDLVLGDFGFARDLAMSAELMSIAGTYHYTAPEVMEVGEVSRAADWWSLGVIVFELLTSRIDQWSPTFIADVAGVSKS